MFSGGVRYEGYWTGFPLKHNVYDSLYKNQNPSEWDKKRNVINFNINNINNK